MQRKPMLVGLVSGLTVLAMQPALGGQAAADVPTCFGKAATIVGTADRIHPDNLQGTAGPDVIVAGLGADRIQGLGGDDLICGGPGVDSIAGGSGADRVNGGFGDDVIFGEW